MIPITRSEREEDQELTARINRVCLGLMRWLGVTQNWKVIYKFTDELIEPEERPHSAEVERRFPYQELTITFSRPKLDEKSDLELEFLVTHELLHEILAGDFERAFKEALTELPLEDGDAATAAQKMDNHYETIVDRAALWISRARPPGGYTKEGRPIYYVET